ncbi:MAG: hypothetical protein V7727_09400, partial [Sneathiella sp.]
MADLLQGIPGVSPNFNLRVDYELVSNVYSAEMVSAELQGLYSSSLKFQDLLSNISGRQFGPHDIIITDDSSQLSFAASVALAGNPDT